MLFDGNYTTFIEKRDQIKAIRLKEYKNQQQEAGRSIIHLDGVGYESGIHRPVVDTAVHGNRVMPHVGPAHPHQPTPAQRNAAAEFIHSDVLGVRAAFLHAPSGHPAGIFHRGARD